MSVNFPQCAPTLSHRERVVAERPGEGVGSRAASRAGNALRCNPSPGSLRSPPSPSGRGLIMVVKR